MPLFERVRQRVALVLPEGAELPVEAWAPRHRWIVRLLWAHVVGLALFGLVAGKGLHSLIEVVPVALFAVAAQHPSQSRVLRSCLAGAGLMTASAILVHLGGGRIELHFHFFVMLPVISLYQAWRPFLVSVGFVALHHATFGVLSPLTVFDHDAAWDQPVKWAAVHAGFVLAASAACVVAWRIIEDSDRAARRSLEESEKRFRSLIEHSSDVVALLDADGTILYESPACANVLGYTTEERIGGDGLAVIHPDDLAHGQEVLGRALRSPGAVERVEVRVRHKAGHHLWIEAVVVNLLEEPGVNAVVANFRDIDARRTLEDALAHQAFHDSLTGLANRALLLDRVEHGLSASPGRPAGDLAVLYLDLDDFKTVNDGLGHHAGDEILRVTAERIRGCLRPSDTAARLGGDEFAVLLPGLAEGAAAYEVAGRILEAVRAPIDFAGTLVSVNASLGVAVSDGTESAAALLRNADVAMYRAKGDGKGRLEVYEAGMHAAVVERLAMKADLRLAIEQGVIVPHYQPIVDIATGRIIGTEALARWDHPERGWVPPDEFIPLAEETGLVIPLGLALLRRACTDAAHWIATLGDDAPRSISVNLSAVQVQHPDIVRDVHEVLQETGLPPAALTLEITESVLVHDAEAAGGTLEALKRLGVRIALDDFGTGFSSLSYLHQFPVDIVKIDKSFIDSLADGSRPPSPLVGAIVNLGTELGLAVTAEGVEDEQQLNRLRRLGCHQAQGYLFARPMSASALEAQLSVPSPAPAVP